VESRRNAQKSCVSANTEPAVLLVEDNEVNQSVASAMLRGHGYHVDVVENGADAIAAVARRPYAAVLMDCQMPVMDGYAATAELRRRENGGNRVPIIALTAHALAGERERCLAAGMDDFLAKPVRADELAAALERHVDPPVVDAGAADRLRDAVGSEEIVAEIFAMFCTQAAAHVEAIERHIAAGDGDAVSRSAHSLKGSALTVGATAVARAAAELERGDRTAMPRLADAVARTRDQLATR
jgi:two-component system, sensor histidine kinase and response regulator